MTNLPRPGDTPLCGGCRAYGHCRLGIGEFQDDGHQVRAPLICDMTFQAGPKVAHGGWTAAMFDDFIGRVLARSRYLTVTGSLTVDFLKPVPIEVPLIVEAAVEGREGRKILMSASLRLRDDEVVLARARGTWVERRADHFERHEADMQDYFGRSSAEGRDETDGVASFGR